jgi:phosphatidylethanolamine/phosphatidyl-N-methylethanolamine N-methyltransferase
MRRVVRPGGRLLFINHFARGRGLIASAEAAMARSSAALGWHPDFRIGALLDADERKAAHVARQWPLGLFTLLELPN